MPCQMNAEWSLETVYGKYLYCDWCRRTHPIPFKFRDNGKRTFYERIDKSETQTPKCQCSLCASFDKTNESGPVNDSLSRHTND